MSCLFLLFYSKFQPLMPSIGIPHITHVYCIKLLSDSFIDEIKPSSATVYNDDFRASSEHKSATPVLVEFDKAAVRTQIQRG